MASATATALDPSNRAGLSKPAPQKRSYSLQAYLRREERSTERHAYHNGQIFKLPMAKGPHNIIAINVATALKIAIKDLPKKYVVMGSNQKIYLPELNIGLYPDVLVVCEKPEYWDNQQLLLINPILIVEVLSPSTKSYDRGDKFMEYRTLPTFQEYILIEQDQCRVDTMFREAPDLWRARVYNDKTATLDCKSLGCSIQIADIYEDVL
jgi:Uma2 family endonuclease